jgi:4,5-dihydroxyphthalate decarboxylase
MADLDLTLACWNYDRTAALADGSVQPEGIRLRCLNVFPAETFLRMVKFKEFDVSELGFKFYVSSLSMKEPPFIAIPVFPLRIFRHSAIFINTGSGIQDPKDLIGKKVGEPFAYGHDAAIWARGILSDEYGVPATSATYHVGAVDQGTRRDFAPFPPSADIKVEQLRPDQTLDAMLDTGEIDALYSAIAPPSFLKGSKTVRRLFPNYEEVERAYFRKTGIFPIMHTVVIRRDVYKANPWIAQSLYKAFNDAKAKCFAAYRWGEQYSNALHGIPWLTSHLDENRSLMGDDPWPYGIEPNRKAIDAFLRYHHEQGLSTRLLRAEDLFAPETLTEQSRFG